MREPPEKLQARLNFLDEEARWNLFAMDLLMALTDLHGDVEQNRDAARIFESTRRVLQRLLDFQAMAFFTVDEATSDFTVSMCSPAGERDAVQREVDALIARGTFAWALNQNRPVIVECEYMRRQMLCHVVATKLRVRGMFIGIFDERAPRLPPEHLYLFSIIIHYTANFLESAALYKLLQDHNHDLEETVRQRLKELRVRDIRFQTVLESAVDGIIVIDEHGTVEIFNPAAERIFGRAAADIMGKNVNLLMPEPQRGEHDQYIAEYLRTGKGRIIGVGPRELQGIRADGSIFPADIAVNEMLLDGKRYFVGIVRDITGRKRTEEELERHRRHLSELVETRTREIKSVHKQLLHTEKLSAIGKLAASIAHEFNNPIYGVRNILEQVRDQAYLPDEYKPLLEIAVKECQRMAGMVRKLQEFYRPSSGVVALLDIHEAIDDMILLTKKEAQKRRIAVKKRFAGGLPRICAVADEIKQVILNLLQNAMDAITAEAGGEIVISTEAADNAIWLKIEDNGCGIPPENLDSIFEPFFTTKSEARGTGLGLAVTCGIVEKHGGGIQVESRIGEGTAFTITLPVMGPPAA